ncbi:FecR family protein [Flagellimonas myxillae]|uniref:FecR family protein n=1 Tax=Flagellimonas myxillae TaxID=2942214 RepID=UPI00201F44C4|nr:FecR domain-containing protein [Muricauda myxillae]MCL6266727.1 DUF4974 domain-containing protein [Muricauda myxillae]
MKILVIKYLTDVLTDEELETLQEWLKIPENQKYFKDMVKASHRLDLANNPFDVDQAYRKTFGLSTQPKMESKKMYYTIAKYAAAILVLVATFFIINLIVDKPNGEDALSTDEIQSEITLELEDGTLHELEKGAEHDIANDAGKTIAHQENGNLVYSKTDQTNIDPTFHILKVPYASRFEVQLSDGSIILLNAGSQLKYPVSFEGLANRNVYLEGEAYFKVAQSKNQPFVVHTEKMNITVFGTEFNVSNYKNDLVVSAVLAEGSIVVSNPSLPENKANSIEIKPGQRVATKNNNFVVQEVNVEEFIAWTKNRLDFYNERFEDILRKLERHFDVNIENNSPELNDRRYTGTFTTETLEEILNLFKRHTPFQYEVANKNITIWSSPTK